MKQDFPLQAEGRAAMHCDALLAHRLTDEDRLAQLTNVVQDIADRLAAHLKRLTGLKCRGLAESANTVSASAYGKSVDVPGVARRQIGLGRAAQQLSLVLYPQGLDAAVGRFFGGAPEAVAAEDSAEPDMPLRLSAQLMRDRVERAVSQAITEILGGSGLQASPPSASSGTGLVVAAREKLATCMITVEGLSEESLRLQLAMREETVKLLLGALRSTTRQTRQQRDATADPWGDIPLPLRAVLADASLPLSRVADLKIGTVLALPIRRRVPLMCEERTLAWGTVGEMDDCAALRITEIEMRGDRQ